VAEIKRKKGESFEAFIRRTKKTWLKSGKLLQARKVQFFDKKKSKNVSRTDTVTKMQKNSKIDYLRKIGRLPEEDNYRRR
jgi:ribosomal protein S21